MSNKKKPKFDCNLLVEILSIQSHHAKNDDAEMMRYITGKAKKFGGTVTTDKYGNLYVTKGKTDLYSCIVAHTDTVHDIVEGYKVFQADDILFAFSSKTQEQTGIGGDDKVGIFMALNALRDLSEMKAVFFRHEEIGCRGSNQANMDFFKDCNIVLQADRRGNSGFVKEAAGVELSSEKWQQDIKPILKERQYKLIDGSITDVMALKRKGLAVCAANIECGYYSPHSKEEVVSITDAEDCFGLMMEIIELCEGVRYEHVYKEPVYTKEKDETDTERGEFRGNYFARAGRAAFGELPFEELGSRSPEKPAIKHDTKPMMTFSGDEEDISELEQAYEEVDTAALDLKSAIDDYIMARTLLKEKQGVI